MQYVGLASLSQYEWAFLSANIDEKSWTYLFYQFENYKLRMMQADEGKIYTIDDQVFISGGLMYALLLNGIKNSVIENEDGSIGMLTEFIKVMKSDRPISVPYDLTADSLAEISSDLVQFYGLGGDMGITDILSDPQYLADNKKGFLNSLLSPYELTMELLPEKIPLKGTNELYQSLEMFYGIPGFYQTPANIMLREYSLDVELYFNALIALFGVYKPYDNENRVTSFADFNSELKLLLEKVADESVYMEAYAEINQWDWYEFSGATGL